MLDCIKCGTTLRKKPKKELICSKCSTNRYYDVVGVTCPACNREFQSREVTYAGLIDECPYC